MIFKVSYVVRDGRLPGGIKNETEHPQIGNVVRIGRYQFQVVEIEEVMPPRGEFWYLHAIVEPALETQQAAQS